MTQVGAQAPVTQRLWQFVVFWHDIDKIEIGQLQGSRSAISKVLVVASMLQAHADTHNPGHVPTQYNRPKGFASAYNAYDPNYDQSENYLAFHTITLANYLGTPVPTLRCCPVPSTSSPLPNRGLDHALRPTRLLD